MDAAIVGIVGVRVSRTFASETMEKGVSTLGFLEQFAADCC